MQILLTNDDGIYAPGLAALERALAELGDVTVVAPATEQSGVGHSITYLTPLIAKEVFDGDRRRGWAVEGSPADCVKIGVTEYCPRRPDLVVSGINYGLNAGINVLYSGTVAAALEGAFFQITSVAVSLEFSEHAQFDRAARLACRVIRRLLDHNGSRPELFNVNLPTAAVQNDNPEIRVAPMGVGRYGEEYEKRIDPRGRAYYWATGELPRPKPDEHTDQAEIRRGFVSVTPLDYDLTKQKMLLEMRNWNLDLSTD